MLYLRYSTGTQIKWFDDETTHQWVQAQLKAGKKLDHFRIA
jgi:hypothetical protein